MRRLLNQWSGWRQWLHRLLLSVALVLCISQLIADPVAATSIYEMPAEPGESWVLDKAEIISLSNEGKINTALTELAKETGFEVRMVSIHRLDYDETAQSFTDKLFEKWFPTATAQANQVLLVIDNLTNNTGIRTGDQVKSVMPDQIATSVAEESVLIPLKEGNKYNQALLGASDRLVAVLSGQTDPGPPELKDDVQVEGTFATPEETQSSNAMVWVIGFLVAATVIPMATYYFYQYMGSR